MKKLVIIIWGLVVIGTAGLAWLVLNNRDQKADVSTQQVSSTPAVQDLGNLFRKKDSSSTEDRSSSSSSSSSTNSSTSSASSTVSQSSIPARWTPAKAQKLADFMDRWGRSMNQYPYRNVTDEKWGIAITNDEMGETRMDVDYSDTGVSKAEYAIVATYEYQYADKSYHRYHFAIRKDGTAVVLYSSNALTYGTPDFYVYKETENQDLRKGFEEIVYSN